MTDAALRQHIIAVTHALDAAGLVPNKSGNVSCRSAAGFLITPAGKPYRDLAPGDLVELPVHGEPPASGRRPSSEWRMHAAIYAARPDAAAIVHLHSTYVTALSCTPPPDGPLIPPYTPYFVMRAGEDVPVVPYFRPGTADMVPQIRDAARRSPAFILAHHGSIVAASSLVSAVNTAEEMEESARIAYLLHGRGASTLTAEQVAALRG